MPSVFRGSDNFDTAGINALRAWVNFDGVTTPPTIRASGNVSSVARTATGDYTINFTNAMPDVNYAAHVSAQRSDSSTIGTVGFDCIRGSTSNDSLQTSSVRIATTNTAGGGLNKLVVCVSVFR